MASPLVPNIGGSPIVQQLMQQLAQGRLQDDRQDFATQEADKQKAALEAQRRFKTAGAQAATLMKLPFTQQRTGAARLAKQAIEQGGDATAWERMLNIQDPDELNLALRQMTINAAEGDKIINKALGLGGDRDKGSQFGAQETFKDEKGNLYFGTTKRNPGTGQVESVLAPIGNAPEAPQGEVKLVSALGLTDKEVVKQEAQIAGGKQEAVLEQQLTFKPQIEAAVTEARTQAAERGEAFTELNQAEAALPGLEVAVGNLRELAQTATSTIGGRAFDTATKELGFGSTEGATARAKFIAIVNNQVLPLLKPTFGSAFTEREGEALKATMGDPDATPAEKMVQLDAFLEQKIRDIETKRARLKQGGQENQTNDLAPPQVLRFDAQGNLIQ